MKKRTMLAATAAILTMVSSCSGDLPDIGRKGDAIRFDVSNNSTSRAAQSYNNVNLPESFLVSAVNASDNSIYFEKDEAKRDGNSATYATTTDRYWPTDALNFHAWVNAGATYSLNPTTKKPQFVNFSPASDVSNQVDLLYAVSLNKTKSDGEVPLNFRHALSQIIFSARNENSNLNISVSGVTIGHIASSGTYSFGDNDTETPYSASSTEYEAGRGTWTLNSNLGNYSTSFQAVTLTSTATTDLTFVNSTGGSDSSLLLLPQKQQAWTPNETNSNTTESGYNGAYFLLDIDMKDATSSSTVYAGKVAFPVDIEWKEGVCYKYTFIFSDGGTGGYKPDPNNPEPLLGKITYQVTTDEFIPVDPNNNPGNDPNNGNGGDEPGVKEEPVGYEAYANEDPNNPLHKFAFTNLTRLEGVTNTFAAAGDNGALYQWGRNYGYIDQAGDYPTPNTSYKATFGADFSNIMDIMSNPDLYNSNDVKVESDWTYKKYRYYVYNTSTDLIVSGTNYNSYSKKPDLCYTYQSLENLKSHPENYFMDYSGNSGDYWISSFGDGGATWVDRSKACGYERINPCPAGWRLPTEAEFNEIMPSNYTKERANLSLATLISEIDEEFRTDSKGNTYMIRWSLAANGLKVQAKCVSSRMSVNWENDDLVVTRTFPYTGLLKPYFYQDTRLKSAISYSSNVVIAVPSPKVYDEDKLTIQTLTGWTYFYPKQTTKNSMIGTYWVGDGKTSMQFFGEKDPDNDGYCDGSYFKMMSAPASWAFAIRPVMDL